MCPVASKVPVQRWRARARWFPELVDPASAAHPRHHRGHRSEIEECEDQHRHDRALSGLRDEARPSR